MWAAMPMFRVHSSGYLRPGALGPLGAAGFAETAGAGDLGATGGDGGEAAPGWADGLGAAPAGGAETVCAGADAGFVEGPGATVGDVTGVPGAGGRWAGEEPGAGAAPPTRGAPVGGEKRPVFGGPAMPACLRPANRAAGAVADGPCRSSDVFRTGARPGLAGVAGFAGPAAVGGGAGLVPAGAGRFGVWRAGTFTDGFSGATVTRNQMKKRPRSAIGIGAFQTNSYQRK